MRTRTPQATSRHVAIFSANPETLDGLEAYLRSAGVHAKGRRRLEECSQLTSASTLAIVLFPDDFPWQKVLDAVAALAASCESTLRVLVTGEPTRYERLVEGRNVMVVPRPVWGWTILDAIRSHSESESASPPRPRRRG
jgi:hypothetical protein